MHWSLSFALCLIPALVIAIQDFNDPKKGKGGAGTPSDCSADAGNKTFEDEYFQGKNVHDCWDISLTGCQTIHEARVKCPCYCKALIAHPDQEPAGRGFTPTPPPATPPPTAAPTAAPATAAPATAAPVATSSGGMMGCFLGESLVSTRDGPQQMASLVGQANVEVLAVNDKNEMIFSPIRYWVHAEPETTAEYVNLKTSSGHKLSLTKEHLIYRVACDVSDAAREPVFADRLQAGQCILVESDGSLSASKIVSRSTERQQGVFSPITSKGSIIVNGVAASCYSYVENEALQKIVYSYVETVQAMLGGVLPETWLSGLFGTATEQVVNIPASLYSFFEFSKSFLYAN